MHRLAKAMLPTLLKYAQTSNFLLTPSLTFYTVMLAESDGPIPLYLLAVDLFSLNRTGAARFSEIPKCSSLKPTDKTEHLVPFLKRPSDVLFNSVIVFLVVHVGFREKYTVEFAKYTIIE